ncbi:MAG: immune inhibitor A [Candidatus Eisenbacteria sp.]|nr:immune inhibitor A [Candidatus Eisenbacteria bacterium]
MFQRATIVLLLTVGIAGIAGLAAAEIPPVKTQAAVFWNTAGERDAILEAFPGLDIMKVKRGHSFIVVTDREELARIEAEGFRTEVMIEDMAAFYASLRKGNNFGDMYTYSEATALLDSLHTEYPEITTARTSIGQSHEGRDIWAIKISDNPNVQEDEPEVLLDALHHAREPITVNVVCDFIKYLCDSYGTNPVSTFLVNERQIWIVPVVNPDGYCYNETHYPGGGGMWRKNRRINEFTECLGVDPNRNYPYMWDHGGASHDPCSDVFLGPYAGSEPEVQAIMGLCNAHEFVTHNSYHSVAGMVLIPWAYTNTHTPDDSILRSMAQRMAECGYQYGQPGEILYNCSGGTLDWSYGEQTTKPKAFSFTTEVSGSGFWPEDSEVAGLVDENLPANIYLVQAAGAYLEVAGIEIADHARGNDQLDPGESADITITLENLGITETLSDVTVILRSYDPYIGLSDAYSDYGSFGAMESKDNSADPFQLSVDGGCPEGRVVTLHFDIYAGGSFFNRESLDITIGSLQTVFSDDFESGTGNWTFAGGAWGLVTSTYTSPTHSITDSPSGDYSNYLNTRMRLASGLDLSVYSSATLTFMHKYEIETGYDYGYVELSVDGGAWTQLGSRISGFQTSWVEATRSLTAGCGHTDVAFRFRLESDTYVTEDGWYIDDVTVSVAGTPNTPPSEPVLARPAEGVTVETSHPALVVLNAADPDPDVLTYGFHLYSDSLLTNLAAAVSGVAEGADSTSWVVNVALEDGIYWWRAWANDGTQRGLCPEPGSFTVQAATEVAGNLPGRIEAGLDCEPNPFSDRALISFSLPARSRAEVSVYNVSGRLVRRLGDGVFEAGPHSLCWDGRDHLGQAVAGGVYFCRIRAEGWERSVKLMVIR